MVLDIEMHFVAPPARSFWFLEMCPVVAGSGMGLAFFKEKEAVPPEYGNGINAFESFEAFCVVSLSAGVAKVRKISS